MHELKRPGVAFDQLQPVAQRFPKVWLIPYTILVLLGGTLVLMADGGNLARLGQASAASVWHHSPDMTPEKAIDGDMQTRWGSEERHAWYQIEWQKPQIIRGAVMRNYDAPWNKNIPFTCQIWDASLHDGKGDFRDVQTVAPVTSTVVFQFPEVKTTKLRVTNVITFWELEVYDDQKTLDSIVAESQKIELAAAGDLRGHLVGSLSRDGGTDPVVNGSVSVAGHSPAGEWRRQVRTDKRGLFSLDLPHGTRGPIELEANDAVATTKLEVDAGDLAQGLTPGLSAKEDHLSLVLLCYVESTKTSSNFRPQQWQKPIHRSNHGRILLSVCSHVTPEVFFGAQVDDRDKQIRQDGQDQVVMKPAPTAPLEVIQTQISLSPLEILFNVPAGTAQA